MEEKVANDKQEVSWHQRMEYGEKEPSTEILQN